jgi:hypothetical protein
VVRVVKDNIITPLRVLTAQLPCRMAIQKKKNLSTAVRSYRFNKMFQPLQEQFCVDVLLSGLNARTLQRGAPSLKSSHRLARLYTIMGDTHIPAALDTADSCCIQSSLSKSLFKVSSELLLDQFHLRHRF